MKESKETSLIIKSDNFFEKVKDFFKLFFSYFGIESNDNLKYKDVSNNENINIGTDGQQMTEEEYEKKFQKLLLELQNSYEEGEIKEEELNSEQIEDLKKIYNFQINYLNECIEKNEAIILKLKEKVEILNINQK